MDTIYAVTTETVVGVTTIVIAGRISPRDLTQVFTDALDYEGAKFLAKSLALATGSDVHVIYANGEGEHNIRARPEQFPGEGPGGLDRSFLLPKLAK